MRSISAACFRRNLLSFFDQRHDVAHAEDTVGHTVGVEGVDTIHLFACADELYGLLDHRTDGEGGTGFGIAIKFGEYYAVEVKTVVKCFGCIDGVLSGHGIDYEQRFRRLDGVLDVRDFVHHSLVHGQATGGIDDYQVVAVAACLFYGVLGYGHGVFAAVFAVYGHADVSARALSWAMAAGR